MRDDPDDLMTTNHPHMKGERGILGEHVSGPGGHGYTYSQQTLMPAPVKKHKDDLHLPPIKARSVRKR